jgi:hypothetical protein
MAVFRAVQIPLKHCKLTVLTQSVETEVHLKVCGRLRQANNVTGMDWIELAQIRDRWWKFLNAVMNFRLP